jgi:alkylhydroperoxidase family enzyme
MANEHGRLPKADPERLDPELRRRFDVWRAKAYQDDNLFLTLARRPAVLDLFLAWVGFIYAGGSSLDPALVELCRIRLAQHNQCVH